MSNDIAIQNPSAPAEQQHSRAERILARFPQVSGREADELVRYIRRARTLDVARIRSDDSLARQLDLFMASHQPSLRFTPSEMVTIAALVIAFLASCWLLAVSS